jgi:hypothetical protein
MGPGHVLGFFRKGDKALSDGVSMSKTRKVLMNKSSGHTALKHLFKNCLTMYPKPQRSESILSMRRVTRPRGTVWYLHWWQTRGPTTWGAQAQACALATATSSPLPKSRNCLLTPSGGCPTIAGLKIPDVLFFSCKSH